MTITDHSDNSALHAGSQPVAAIIGGGPAGLTAAYCLQKYGVNLRPVVFEADALPGGISRTESYKGYRFDIGGHRFFTKVDEVNALWLEVGGDDFIWRDRKSRIYYRGKFYAYPLKPINALTNLGPIEAVRIVLSYMRWKMFPSRVEDNFEQWVVNRFGRRLFDHFFETYTQKVWGIPCSEIRADWAAQRIKNLSLFKAVWNAFTGANDTTSLIDRFQYPRLGPGMMWEAFTAAVRTGGGEVNFNTAVQSLKMTGNCVTQITINGPTGEETVSVDEVISTMPLRRLVNCIEPSPPQGVIDAAAKLKYRDFLIVTLILDHEDPFDDNWIYIHSPDVKVGRIQNFRAWSPEMVPVEKTASIGMEYFCNVTDEMWNESDESLIAMATRELGQLGLADPASVIDGTVIRQPKAYPVYDTEYKDALGVIREWIDSVENLQTVGRNGMHRYNNQDHSMLTAMLAARNLTGEDHDLWTVNVERSYHEEFQVEPKTKQKS
ncbi:NAD(P)/FAD-dependent oxidoreductase [Parvularcula sp. LCG005]|nr:NAD(P)/FAD-dependent oxidoreductase [Parvularcula sp. LCG005]WOI54052.1 NAD(P)/FAD-dependent oxidoreductase [Parvularcula sp. LCG005]